MTTPLVAIVILNFNRRADTLTCLESLAASSYRTFTITVLDAGSTDESVATIRAQRPDVHMIELQSNDGYAGNNNVGIRHALAQGADWVLVLNEDTILDPDCLSALVAVATADPHIGIVGPMVYHHNEPGLIQSAGGAIDRHWQARHLGQNEPDRGQFTAPHDVQWISGCAIMVRRDVIYQIGALDARFFYYWEEVEWCVRATRAGWRIVHVPAARLWHKGVQREYQPGPGVTYYSTRNQLLLLQTHRAPINVWLHVIGTRLRTLASWTIRPRWRSLHAHRNALAQGLLDFARQRWGARSAPQRS